MTDLTDMGRRAQDAARGLAGMSDGQRGAALVRMADALEAGADYIRRENAKDMAKAETDGLSAVLLDRLLFTEARIAQNAAGVRQVAALPSPLGRVTHSYAHPNGMSVEKVTVPLGVIAIIYEARPNVTADAVALCLKAGNAVILRGGREAIGTNTAVADTLAQAAEAAGLPRDCVQLVTDTRRESAVALMQLKQYVDAIFPRGGEGLIQAVMRHATVPAIETGTGNCHIYADADADIEKAVAITVNAKVSRPSVCNAAEKLLVHRAVAERLIPRVCAALREKGVEIRGDEQTRALYPDALAADDTDWPREYLDMIIGIKVVADMDEAIRHINRYATHHSEAIVSENAAACERFLAEVDSSTVYANVSTRFTDGFEFGLGAEMGISTQKVHVRGPIGLDALTSTKYLVRGKGQVRV